jgi:hypothetical protein
MLMTPYPSEKYSVADSMIYALYASSNAQPAPWLVLNAAEAKCLAGLLFAATQFWKRYAPYWTSAQPSKSAKSSGTKNNASKKNKSSATTTALDNRTEQTVRSRGKAAN